MSFIPAHDITGLVLAGGQGRRMGGRDKGLMEVHGQPLTAWALARLAKQTGAQAISANRHLDVYRQLGVSVWPDEVLQDGTRADSPPTFSGPLAGIAAGLAHCATPWLAVVPCDSPCFPADLVQRLAHGVLDAQADLALATVHQEAHGHDYQHRPQPVFCLLHTRLLPDVRHFVQSGGRKVLDWMQQCRHACVPFDDANAFAGANTPDELKVLAQRLHYGCEQLFVAQSRKFLS